MVLQSSDAVHLGGSLARALRYVNAWKGRTVVVKYGGSVLSAADQGTVVGDLVLLQGAGVRPVLVHGGGPEITRVLERFGKESRFVNGLRVTDAETMEIVEMVLAGRANKALVSMIARAGGAAVGISGKDGNVFQARRLDPALGQVGEIERVDTALIRVLSEAGYIPVVASIAGGADGESYNLNADTAAGALAAALGASKFILLTDVRGVYAGPPEDGALLSVLRAAEAARLIAEGVISRGMIPKVQACLDAVAAGVPTAHIISGSLPHALLVELFTEEGVGTMIVADSAEGGGEQSHGHADHD
ncbi:MAG: acetylglutamate kinase [Armatimonadota bacterium]|nr:acetylglutamate kinase [Armatimonadota bacterium]MDR7451251.1 acetylglutamate kinase [Armatimonadota bacterium]MDR7466846.1 acetylglutamate kinase [Armatimonadota bacterium]MDR7492681.1 acetylglutamate kinase [Armatimonadota bacterium]MDR7499610.1 acetylglutamate kinase [Armatimonadota bacterium]